MTVAEISGGIMTAKRDRRGVKVSAELYRLALARAEAADVNLGQVLNVLVSAVDDGRLEIPIVHQVQPRDYTASIYQLNDAAKAAPADLIARLIHAYGLRLLPEVRVTLSDEN